MNRPCSVFEWLLLLPILGIVVFTIILFTGIIFLGGFMINLACTENVRPIVGVALMIGGFIVVWFGFQELIKFVKFSIESIKEE